jgi:hypothetical protein
MIEPFDSQQYAAADALRYLVATRIHRCAVVKLRGF